MDWYPVKPTQAQKRDANGQDHRAEPRAHVVGQQGTGPLHFPEPRGPWGRAVSPCMVPPAPEAQSEGQATAGPAPDGEQSAGSPPDRSDPCVSQLRCDVEKCAKRIALCAENRSEGSRSGAAAWSQTLHTASCPFGLCPGMINSFEKARESLGWRNSCFRHSAVYLDFSLPG